MFRTDKTLYEQQNMSEHEIDFRLSLVGLSRVDLKKLYRYLPFMKGEADVIVEEFYEQQLQIDEVALLIEDAETLSRLKKLQVHYIITLFEATCDEVYVSERLRVGLVHKRIGVEPKLFISAIKCLKDLLFLRLEAFEKDEQLRYEVFHILDKIISFDMTLIFDTYIYSLLEELKIAHKKSEKYTQSLEEEVKQRTQELHELAMRDPLSGLYNQRAFYELFRKLFAQHKRNHNQFSLAYLDVDKFKQINDTKGHIYGDTVLRGLSDIISEVIREEDIACRYGGDEFCIIFLECSDTNAHKRMERINEAFQTRFSGEEISYGVASSDEEEFIDIDSMIQCADKKMYAHKNRTKV